MNDGDNFISSKMSYSIVPAQKKYIYNLPEISRAAAELFSEKDLPLALRSETTPVNIFEDALNDQRLWVVIDEEKDFTVGFALLLEKCGQIHLRELDVHPDHTRQGLGTNLLKAVILWAKNQKYDQISLTTFRHLPWNAPFYSKLGFKIIEKSQFSPCLLELFNEEAKGLNKSNRVLMLLNLKRKRT